MLGVGGGGIGLGMLAGALAHELKTKENRAIFLIMT
jgi:hypothetical protein